MPLPAGGSPTLSPATLTSINYVGMPNYVGAFNHLRRCYDLCHKVVIPFTLYLDMGRSTQRDCFDQVMVHIGIQARLAERVECRPSRPAANKPCLEVGCRKIIKRAGLLDQVTVAADQMGAGVAVGLGVDKQHFFPDIRR